MSSKMKLPGWKQNGVAYDHASGVRCLVAGFALVDGEFISGNTWPESQKLDLWIRIHGGNRRRGVMAWSLSLRGAAGRGKARQGQARFWAVKWREK